MKRLTEFLDRHEVAYEIIPHATAFTALEIAETAHVSGKELAKAVVVKLDGEFAMAVLPACERVMLGVLADATGHLRCELATEEEFRFLFPGCELGAMPPFGNLFGLKVYVAPDLERDEFIDFNAGSHTELIRMAYEDFAALSGTVVLDVAVLR